MRLLKSGQHFGINKRTLKLDGSILTEATSSPEMSVPLHYHENAYFFFHLSGKLDEVNKKNTVTCVPGTLLFHHWQDPHYDKNFSDNASFFHVEIEDRWFIRHHLKPSIVEGSMQLKNPILKTVVRKIHREMTLALPMSIGTATQLSVDGLLLQAIAELTRSSEDKTSQTPGWVRRVRDILNDSDRESVTLQMLSKETGVHPVHLSKEFPKYFNCGFGEYVRNTRIEKAISLLSKSSMTLSEIAHACSFSDESHFIRCFKEVMSTTPGKFRKVK